MALKPKQQAQIDRARDNCRKHLERVLMAAADWNDLSEAHTDDDYDSGEIYSEVARLLGNMSRKRDKKAS